MKRTWLLWCAACTVGVLRPSFDLKKFRRLVAQGNARAVFLAIRAGDIDPNMYFDEDTKETLLIYAAWSDNIEMVRVLLTRPDIDVTCYNVAGETAYFWAIENNNTEILDLLDAHDRRYRPRYHDEA